jgi:hypothetical protein
MVELTMKPVYEVWKSRVAQLPAAEAEFECWLFVKISGVLFGKKGGELLMLRQDQSRLSCQERLRLIAKLASSWKFSCLLLSQNRDSAKVIVYDRTRTRRILARIPVKVLDRLGYQPPVGARRFLGIIKQRWQITGRIPHEVGLALGYPLKDVVGFMGLYPLEYTGGCGWRIYGNPTRSLRRSVQFRQARERAIKFLNP